MLPPERLDRIQIAFDDPHCLNKTVTQREWLTQIECYRYSVAQGPLVNPATTFEIPWSTPSERSATTHQRTRLEHPSFRRPPTIDTHGGSHNGHYVNHSVREISPPARLRFPPPRFDPP